MRSGTDRGGFSTPNHSHPNIKLTSKGRGACWYRKHADGPGRAGMARWHAVAVRAGLLDEPALDALDDAWSVGPDHVSSPVDDRKRC